MLALVLAGCGPEGWSYQSDCVEFQSAVGLYQNKIDRNVLLAKTAIDGKFGAGTFCANQPASMYVKSVSAWDCESGGQTGRCTGYAYGIGKHIDLGNRGTAMLHELLHIYEINHGIFNTGEHPYWNLRGYDAMDHEYEFATGENDWLTP